MMQIELCDLQLRGGRKALSLSLEINPVAVIQPHSEELCKELFNCLSGLREPLAGKILIDGQDHKDLILSAPLPKVFGFVIDRGIMLSNLSLRENLLLPYRIIKENLSEESFDREVKAWMDSFELDLDLNLRPAWVKASEIKLLSIIRVLLFKPRLLILDDPYFLLSQPQREITFRVLTSLRQQNLMLISSLDDDFVLRFEAVPISL